MAQGEGGGRPTKYRAAYHTKKAKALIKLGATIYDIAQFFEVDETTIYAWMHEHPKFSQSVKVAVHPANRKVEMSLYRRATGYSYQAEKIFCSKDGEVTRVEYTEHVPPDPTAMIFWLKNRMRGKWRDFKATELSTAPGSALAMTYVPPAPQLLQDYYAKIAQSAPAADPDSSVIEHLGSDGPDGEEPGGGEGFSPR